MQTNTDFALTVIAAALVAQVLVLLGSLAWAWSASRRLGRRLDHLERDLQPRLGSVTDGFARLADGLSRLSEDAHRQLAQVESAVSEASGRVRSTGETVERVTHHPAGLLAAALALTVARRFAGRRPTTVGGAETSP
jgi:hypothetical protein